MTKASISFFILALFAILFGNFELWGMNIEMGKILFMIFLTLSLLSYAGSLLTGKKN